MTGMRIGEAAALQWSDIDFETGILSINKNLYYKSMTEYKFVEPKTQAGARDIVIDDDTIKELKEWKEVQQKVLANCDFVMSYSGIPTSKHTLPRALEKLAELAGVHRIKIHALRHPYVKPTTKNKLAAKAEIPNYQHEFDSLRFLLFCLDVQVAHDKQKPYSSNVTYVS